MDRIFAYGSLLNKATWSFNADIELVRADGWVRQWRQIVQTDKGIICALTISPSSKSSIDGILLEVSDSVGRILNKREVGYNKTKIPASRILQSVQGKIDVSLKIPAITYTASKSTIGWATKKAPILLSYIDVVAKGYFDLFGLEGAKNFFNTTQGWNLPILNDRDKPLYPRAVQLNTEFLELVDQQILLHA